MFYRTSIYEGVLVYAENASIKTEQLQKNLASGRKRIIWGYILHCDKGVNKMRLTKARVQGYRSVIDSGWFEVENGKTILVGPNEAGKTAILQALQKLNPPEGVELFNPLRDYPRAKYDEDIEKGIKIIGKNIDLLKNLSTMNNAL